jgi:acetylornithine deacetylase/succinyl-diaminopimelate desuccinylase-like protein
LQFRDTESFDVSLTERERLTTEEIEQHHDDFVALATDLISFNTTSRDLKDPPREEADLQEYLAGRLRFAGAETRALAIAALRFCGEI